MTEERREMLENIVGVIGWSGYGVAINTVNGDYEYVREDRFYSNPKYKYISLTDFDFWDEYLLDFKEEGEEDYEEIYRKACSMKKDDMVGVLQVALFGEIG